MKGIQISKIIYRVAKFSGLLGAVGASLLFATPSAQAISVTQSDDATALANTLIGTGITLVGTPNLSGASIQSGTFTGGATDVGISSGIVLSSGNVNNISGTNLNGGATESVGIGNEFDDDYSTDVGTPGDVDLNALSGFSTFDASILEFDFQFSDGSVGGDLFFNFVFASEEYVDFIGSEFNDVFGFFVDDNNVALVPGTSTPITINTINNISNSAFYVNNVANTDGIPVAGRDVLFDGMTTVITAQALALGIGVHTMKFAVADASDGILDAGVFLQGGSFSSGQPSVIPVPAAVWLFGSALVGLFGFGKRRKTV
ncbi:MAG: choice-of-anchor L domain-containing protein [Gammaproteobacteria bacterium]|nr:choice-of-anchor L domain-containing protein [Gammaproteobacteria bacterium]